MNDKALFQRLVQLKTEIEVLKADVKQLKDDVTYHKDHNPSGLSKDDVKLIDKAAAVYVKANYEELSGEFDALRKVYEELTDYNV